jgi:hypothetical protein
MVGRGLCFRCGVTQSGVGVFRFHDGAVTKNECGSGMGSTAESYCWYLYRQRKDLLRGFFPDGVPGEIVYQKWISSRHNDFSVNMYLLLAKTYPML